MKDTEKLLATVVGVLNILRDKYKIVEKNDDFIKLEIETEAIKDSNDKMMISSSCLGKLEMKKHFRE